MPALSKLLGRSGRRYQGAVVRAEVRGHAGATGYFATKADGSPNQRRPLRWVRDDEHKNLGYFEEA